MKKIFFLLIFSINLLTLSAQDIAPVPLLFNFTDNANNIHANDSLKLEYFPQDKFVLGYHWGGFSKISQALLMNQKDAILFT